jgi:hypothetical protein
VLVAALAAAGVLLPLVAPTTSADPIDEDRQPRDDADPPAQHGKLLT